MKKGKEWFIKELIGHEIGDYGNYYNGGYEDGLAYAIELAHQLDEPVKVVIPQFVAEFIEDSRNKVGCIVTAIWEMYEYEYKHVYEWALEDGNDEVLMKAFVNGYEIEKEKLYYTVDEKGQTLLFKSQERGIRRSSGTELETVLRVYGRQSLNMYQLTEKEIKGYDPRFMAFAVEVAE